MSAWSRDRARTAWPRRRASATRARPSMPVPPRMRQRKLGDPHLGVVPEHETVGLGLEVGLDDAHVPADQRAVDAQRDVADLRVGEDDRVLHLAADQLATFADRGVRTDEGVLQAGAVADDDRPAHQRVDELDTGADLDL